MKKLLILSLLLIACQSEPKEFLTSQSAKTDSIQLLNDLQIKFEGIHCGEPRQTFMAKHDYVICDITTKEEMLKTNCRLHDCQLLEKRALRIKFGFLK